MTTNDVPAEVLAAIERGDIIVCYTRCWGCQFDDHFQPPKWHTWADEDDVAHAAATNQANPSDQRCGCPCANAESGVRS